jgi:putative transposase
VANAEENLRFLGKFHVHVRSKSSFEPGKGPLPFCEEGRKGPEGWYCVKLRDLVGSCTCPDFEHGHRCKHLWAVRLSADIRTAVERPLPPTTSVPTLPVPSVPPCRRCGGMQTIKRSHRVCKRGRVQRFQCKHCGFRFTVDDGFSHIRVEPRWVLLSLDLWVKKASFREIADTLTKSVGVPVSKSTVERWVHRMAILVRTYADEVKLRPGGVWHADETTVGVKGELLYTWNYMEHESRFWLASYIARGRDGTEARRSMQKAKAVAGGVRPDILVTDGLASYNDAAKKEFYRNTDSKPGFEHMVILPLRAVPERVREDVERHVKGPEISSSVEQNAGKRVRDPSDGKIHVGNNIIERLQGTQRDRTKVLRHFKRIETAQVKLDGFRGIYNFVRPHMGLKGQTPAEAAGVATPEMSGASRLEALVRAGARKVEAKARETRDRAP